MNNNSNNKICATTRNGNSTTQACAACKYQRRKCAPDCILAPYFPHDRQRQFLNAHKLFGVSNITKIIKFLSPQDKDQAMRTIIYQSDMRAADPVGGCYRYILDLQSQIEYYRAELELVLQQLAIFRAQQQQQHSIYAPVNNSVNVALNGDGEVLNADPLGLYNQQQQHQYQCLQQVQQEEQYVMVHENNCSQNSNGAPSAQEQMNTWAAQNTAVSLSLLSLQGQSSNVSDEFDHKPVVIDIDSDERSELGFESEDLVHHRRFVYLYNIFMFDFKMPKIIS